MPPSAANRCEIAGRLLEVDALRYTPAGIPVVAFSLAHASGQVEAETPRRVECEVACVALASTALLLRDAKPGDGLVVSGFLAAKSAKNRSVVLHVNRIEFVEGNQHGIQTEE